MCSLLHLSYGRHELGHSIIEVGEEYDGGFAYFGVNAAHNASEAIPWAHWLTHVNSSSGGLPRVERMVMPIQDYAWTLLNSTSAWSAYFNSSGTYSRYLVRFSLSGLPEKDDLSILFDGEDLGWTPKEGLGVDRYFYDIYKNERLSEGEHKIEFVLKNAEREGIAQMCSIEVLEYGSEQECVSLLNFAACRNRIDTDAIVGSLKRLAFTGSSRRGHPVSISRCAAHPLCLDSRRPMKRHIVPRTKTA